MNSKGQLIITDLIVYIIILTIIFSMLVYTINNINNNQVMTLNNYESNQLVETILDTLVKTEGTPANWDTITENNIKTIGLRENSTSSMISYDKLIKLKNNNYLLTNMFPEGTCYSLIMYPKNNPTNITYIAGNHTLDNNKSIYSKEADIILDFGYNIFRISDNDVNNKCPYNHENKNGSWSCKPLEINNAQLGNGIFYIVTRNNVRYILTNSYNQEVMDEVENTKNINNNLKTLLSNDNDTIYIHINTNKNNTYIIYDTKNRHNYLNYILDPEIYKLRLTIAT
ncbi:hypothetical protein [Methanosphaera sp. WGK6]|uniref:hypothetical protein n=1 Tax=Methanosphaera sp. WGK6 TaxID=1561964 RepID=UPI00084C6ED9|nr:hypothetical protein [Methanosphaera sp. WGK6]OED30774.1 hypothetical protein NL43_00160 [Methanosphaera sp. WGK6]